MFGIPSPQAEKHNRASRRSEDLMVFSHDRIFGFNTELKELIMSERRNYLDSFSEAQIKRLWDFTVAIDPHKMLEIVKKYLPEFVTDDTRFLVNVGYRRAPVDTIDRHLIETGFHVRDIAYNIAAPGERMSRSFGFNLEPFITRDQLTGKRSDVYVDKYVRNPAKVNMSMCDPFLFHVLADLLNGGDGDCGTLQIPSSKKPFRDLYNIPMEELINNESWFDS